MTTGPKLLEKLVIDAGSVRDELIARIDKELSGIDFSEEKTYNLLVELDLYEKFAANTPKIQAHFIACSAVNSLLIEYLACKQEKISVEWYRAQCTKQHTQVLSKPDDGDDYITEGCTNRIYKIIDDVAESAKMEEKKRQLPDNALRMIQVLEKNQATSTWLPKEIYNTIINQLLEANGLECAEPRFRAKNVFASMEEKIPIFTGSFYEDLKTASLTNDELLGLAEEACEAVKKGEQDSTFKVSVKNRKKYCREIEGRLLRTEKYPVKCVITSIVNTQ